MRQKQSAKYAACFCGFAHFPHRRGWCTTAQRTLWTEETERQYRDRREAEARRDRLARLRKAG